MTLPALTACLLAAGPGFALAQAPVHHALTVDLTPAAHRVVVRDEVSLSAGANAGREFLLSDALTITSATPPVERVALGDTSPFTGNNGSTGSLDARQVARYRFKTPPQGQVRLAYDDAVHPWPHPARGSQPC